MSYINDLSKRGLIKPPPFVRDGTQYEALMGSEAYGVSSGDSDRDIYGFCIPPKNTVFPHLAGEIVGFGEQWPRFNQYQQAHILDLEAKKEVDISIYGIVRYFQLCMENNPNMIDSLFVPERCVLFSTKIGQTVRDNRRLFLHKGSWYKFKGYAFSQMRKMKSQTREGKRKEVVDEYGYDLKFAYHVVRLINEVEQILMEGNLEIDRNREQLKTIRSGGWTLTQVEQYFYDKEKSLEELYTKSSLQHSPDENKIKALLLACLEEYYGTIREGKTIETTALVALSEVNTVLDKYRFLL